MSQGSYGTQTNDLGSYPVDFNAWDKFQLGILGKYQVAASTQHELAHGPTREPQPRHVLAHPGIARHPEQNASHLSDISVVLRR